MKAIAIIKDPDQLRRILRITSTDRFLRRAPLKTYLSIPRQTNTKPLRFPHLVRVPPV